LYENGKARAKTWNILNISHLVDVFSFGVGLILVIVGVLASAVRYLLYYRGAARGELFFSSDSNYF